MELTIRKAVKEDCRRLLELVQELATYERAPAEVTVTLEHFVESGFGKNPVWFSYVATVPLQSSPFPPPSGFPQGNERSSPTKGV